MKITAESKVRERMGAAPFTVAELYTLAAEHVGRDAVGLVNKIIQAEKHAGRIHRIGGGKWAWREPPVATPRDEDDDDGQVGIWRAMRQERQREREVRLEAAEIGMDLIASSLASLGLALVKKSEHHYHVTRGGRLVAQWWPSTGRTMVGQQRWHFDTVSGFAAWVMSLVEPVAATERDDT